MILIISIFYIKVANKISNVHQDQNVSQYRKMETGRSSKSISSNTGSSKEIEITDTEIIKQEKIFSQKVKNLIYYERTIA